MKTKKRLIFLILLLTPIFLANSCEKYTKKDLETYLLGTYRNSIILNYAEGGVAESSVFTYALKQDDKILIITIKLAFRHNASPEECVISVQALDIKSNIEDGHSAPDNSRD